MKKVLITLLLALPFALYFSNEASTAAVKIPKEPRQDSIAAASITRGRALYTQYCMPCHQADGSGVPRLNPPLIKTSFVLGDKTRLITILLKGLSEEIEIEGEYYSNPMPAFNYLKDQEIADVLTFVRNNFGNKAKEITADEVKNIRTTIK